MKPLLKAFACVCACALFATESSAAIKFNDVVGKLRAHEKETVLELRAPAAEIAKADADRVVVDLNKVDIGAIKNLATESSSPLQTADLNRVANATTLVAARTGTETIAQADGTLVVPIKYASVVDSNVHTFVPVAILANGGFRYEPSKGVFIARILIGLQDIEDVTASYVLGRPVAPSACWLPRYTQ